MSAEVMSPFAAFRFELTFQQDPVSGDSSGSGAVAICQGSFSECSGLEATMEPKQIKEGGRNYGAAQRMGQVSFGNVVLKRGITSSRDLWRWFSLVSGGASAYRLTAVLEVRGPSTGRTRASSGSAGGSDVTWRWQLQRCLPVKFKVPTASATSSEIAIEELHLAHEGLYLID